jgi:hypothetical protein
MVVFKFIAVTTTGGITRVIFDEDEEETLMSLGESTVTSNLHQLTCKHKQAAKFKKEKGGLCIGEKNYIILCYL